MSKISSQPMLRKIGCKCRECGSDIIVVDYNVARREFCSATCRSAFHNRRKQRGAELYSLVMAMRFDRDRAREDGAWSLLCRMASSFKAEDDRERAGLKSWEPVAVVKARHPDLSATVVSR
jgi:hypothetical protein